MKTQTIHSLRRAGFVSLAGALALSLAACQAEEPAGTTYETDIEDLSGGEIIVTKEDPEAIDVELPETEMTPVPDAEGKIVEMDAAE